MDENKLKDSVDVARAAVALAITPTRADEERLIKQFRENGIIGGAVDVGGDVISQTHLIIERSIIAARKNGLIQEDVSQDGAVAGAAREAQTQIINKAAGLNGGGKIAVCRIGENISVCIFMSVGMMYLNEVVIGLGHRMISKL